MAHEPKFLSENIVLYSLEKKPKYLFVFDRGQRGIAKAIAASLQDRLMAPLETQPTASLPELADSAKSSFRQE